MKFCTKLTPTSAPYKKGYKRLGVWRLLYTYVQLYKVALTEPCVSQGSSFIVNNDSFIINQAIRILMMEELTAGLAQGYDGCFVISHAISFFLTKIYLKKKKYDSYSTNIFFWYFRVKLVYHIGK